MKAGNQAVEETLLSIQVGMPVTVGDPNANDPMGRPWTSAIFKEPVSGPIWVDENGMPGDGHVYEGHGGPDRAVFVSSVDHYSYWCQTLNRDDMVNGGFGENFTTTGMLETDVCLGDIYRIGKQLLAQVTEPRMPCWKLAFRFRLPDFAVRMDETGWTGFYMRVLEAGYAESGNPVVLIERPEPNWTIRRAHQVYIEVSKYPEDARELSRSSYLSVEMRASLREYIEQGHTGAQSERWFGNAL